MEACGRRYVIDFAESEWRERQNALAFQTYVTDMLNGYFTKGKAKRFYDFVQESKKPPKPPQTSAEVIARIKRKFRD